jgi:hypothetical protein
MRRRLALAEQIAAQTPDYQPGGVVSIDEDWLCPLDTTQARDRGAQLAKRLTSATMTDQDWADLQAYARDPYLAAGFLGAMDKIAWKQFGAYPGGWFETMFQAACQLPDFTPDLTETYMHTTGIDALAATTLQEIWDQINTLYSDKYDATQRARFFNLLIADFEYGDTSKELLEWWATTGTYRDYLAPTGLLQLLITRGTIFTKLGISPEDATHLKNELDMQYTMSEAPPGITNKDDFGAHKTNRDDNRNGLDMLREKLGREPSWEEFNSYYSRMQGRNDLAHQAITTATLLDEAPFRPEGVVPGDRRDQAGWLGDADGILNVEPDMSGSDYKSDLDAVNIAARMGTSSDYGSVINQYAKAMTNGSTNRATEFKRNVPMEHVRDGLGNRLQRADPNKHDDTAINFIESLETDSNEDHGTH